MFKKALSIVALALGISSGSDTAVGVGSTAADMQNRVNNTLVGSKGKDSSSDIKSGSSALSGSEVFPILTERVTSKKHIQNRVGENIHNTLGLSKGKTHVSKDSSSDSDGIPLLTDKVTLALATNTQTQIGEYNENTLFPDSQRFSDSQKGKYSSDAIILADGTRFTGPELGDSHGNNPDTYFQGQKNHSDSGTIPLFSNGALTVEVGGENGNFDSYHLALLLGDKSGKGANNSPLVKIDVSKDNDGQKALIAVGTPIKGKTSKDLSGNIIGGAGVVNDNTNLHGQSVFVKGTIDLPSVGSAYIDIARQHVNDAHLSSISTTATEKVVTDLPDVLMTTEKTTRHTTSIDFEGKFRNYVKSGLKVDIGEQGVFDIYTSGIQSQNMGYGLNYKQYLPNHKASVGLGYQDNHLNNPISLQVQKLVSQDLGLSVGVFAQANTDGKFSPKVGVSLTVPLGGSSGSYASSGMYSRPNSISADLNNIMYSLSTRDGVLPDNLIGMGNLKTTQKDEVISEKITKTNKAPELTVDPTKVEINPDNTVTFTVASSILGTTYRYQIDGGEWIVVSYSGTEQKITTKALSAGPHTLNILAERVTPEGQKISSEIKSFPVTLSSDLVTTVTLDATDITTSSFLAKCNIADTDGASGTCTLKDSLGQVVKTWPIGSDTPLSGLTAGETYTLEVSGISITKNPNGSLSQKQIHQTKTIQVKNVENPIPPTVNFAQSVPLIVGEITPSQIIGTIKCEGEGLNNCTFSAIDPDFSVNPTTGDVSVKNASLTAGSREVLMMVKDKRGGSLQCHIKVDVQQNRVDNQERVASPRIIPTRTSVSFEGGSVIDADNPSNMTVTFDYVMKDLKGNTISRNQLNSNTEYEAFASYLTIDGKTNTLVKKTISLGVFKTLDLPTPPAPTFTIDDSLNIINWNGTNSRVYEISKDGGKTWSTPFVGQNFGDNDVDVLLRKKAISGESYAGNVQTLTFTKEPLPENTPGVLSEISGASIYIPGTTSQIYSVSFVDPDGVLSVIAQVNGINTPVTKNGDTYSISLPPDMPPGKHKVDFISQGEEPDGTAELIQIESMDVTVPEEPLPTLNPDVVTGSITGSPTVVNVLSNDQAPDGKTLQLIDAKLTSGEGQVTFNTSGDVTFTPSANMIAGMAPGESKTVTVSYMVIATSSSSIARSASFVPPKVSMSTLSVEYTRPALIDATVSFPTSSVTKDVGQTYSQALVTNSTGTITYSSGNTAIATVDARSGIVSFNAPGSTVIIANQPADGKYKAATASYVVNGVALNLSGPTLSIPIVQCLLAYNPQPGLMACSTDLGDVTLTGFMANDPNGLGAFTIVSSIFGTLASGTGNLPPSVVISGSKIIGRFGQDDTITITSTDTHPTNPKTSVKTVVLQLR